MVSASLIFYELRCTKTALWGIPLQDKFTLAEVAVLKVSNGVRRTACRVIASLALGLTLLGQTSRDWAQTTTPAQPTPSPSQTPKDQGIPDAPSAVQPPAPENPLPAPSPGTQPPPAPSENQAPPRESAPQTANPSTPPPINIRTVPEGGATGGATNDQSNTQEKLFTIIKNVNQVMVPVTVKDESGRLVNGLVAQDFTVLENGKKRTLNFFTSDPFALSAAVILDLGMQDVYVQKVSHTFPALQGAFSEFDEVSIFAYSNTVSQISSWGAAGQQLAETLDKLSEVRGRNNGPGVAGGPLGPGGPTINNMPVDPAAPSVYTPPRESRVMNDAILKAALDLSHRDKTRRRVIFIISDGREFRSQASYRDVLQVLLKNNIMVYAINVSTGSAIPGYNTLSKLHIPRLGYTDILPKYVNATTGTPVIYELTRTGIEDAYLQAMGDARNQYTLGYPAEINASGTYRSIEVLVNKPSCRSSIRPCVNVYARDGYYPAPPAPLPR